MMLAVANEIPSAMRNGFTGLQTLLKTMQIHKKSAINTQYNFLLTVPVHKRTDSLQLPVESTTDTFWILPYSKLNY